MGYLNKTLETPQLSALSGLFSSRLVRELAKKGYSPMFARLARESSLLELADLVAPIGNFFDLAFSVLKHKSCRHEYIYRAAITHKVLLGKHSLSTSVMLNEFRVCNNKADAVILNGTSTVYEIKSERDTLSRLEQQIDSYCKVFARVNVITGENHLNAVMNMVPRDVGVLLLTDRYQISTIREALDLPSRTIPDAVFDAIQLSEAKKILKINGFDIPNVPNTQMYTRLRSLFQKLSPDMAHDGMVQVLRSSRSLMPLCDLIQALPDSIQPAILNTPMRKKDHENLLTAINCIPLEEALNWG
ncbi:MAG: hypothetical protein EOM12_07210 [Verrucomicrobiae bacterium]|nr:hypothetical protein [Verrucomicrobiae bacterium]